MALSCLVGSCLPVTFLEGSLAEWLRFAGAQHALWKEVSYKMHFREVADARTAAFFNTKGGSEPGKSSSADRRLRNVLASCPDHSRIMLESSLHCN